MDRKATFVGSESGTAFLNNAQLPATVWLSARSRRNRFCLDRRLGQPRRPDPRQADALRGDTGSIERTGGQSGQPLRIPSHSRQQHDLPMRSRHHDCFMGLGRISEGELFADHRTQRTVFQAGDDRGVDAAELGFGGVHKRHAADIGVAPMVCAV